MLLVVLQPTRKSSKDGCSYQTVTVHKAMYGVGLPEAVRLTSFGPKASA